MNLKEYINREITLGKQPDLRMIYQELLNLGFESREIYNAINKQINENINKLIEEHQKKKNEK